MYKKHIFSFVVICLSFATGYSQSGSTDSGVFTTPDPKSFYTYSADDGSIEVVFVAEPSVKKENLSDGGQMTTLTVDHDEASFTLKIADLKGVTTFSKSKAKQLLEEQSKEALAEMRQNPETTTVKVTKVERDGIPGRQVEYEDKLGYGVTSFEMMQVFIFNSTIIELKGTATFIEKDHDRAKSRWRAEVLRFFNSLKLIQ